MDFSTEQVNFLDTTIKPPILAFKQPPNLKQKLVRRKLANEQLNTKNLTKPCNKCAFYL
ncbi:uncharacterized protein O3C94_006246 [Discoglossus pictus]